MKRTLKAAGVVIAMSMGLATAVLAHPGQMGSGMEQGATGSGMHGGMGQGMMGHGMRGGMAQEATGSGMRGGMGQGMMGQGMHAGKGQGAMNHGGATGPAAAQQLLTPEERTALVDKMRNAKTPEERQQIAQANRAEMEKRAKDKGITLPQGHGPRAGFGPHVTPPATGTR